MQTAKRSGVAVAILVAVGISVAASLAVQVAPEKLYTADGNGIRAIRDDHELTVFYTRGSWLPRDVTPYGKDSFQEYPQLGLAYITLPLFVTSDYTVYRAILITMNLVCGIGLIFFSYRLIRLFGASPWFLLLLVLPSMLYFIMSRFDVLIALCVQASVYFLLVRRHRLSFFLLACAVLVKWYPVILLPLFWLYSAGQPSALRRQIWKDLGWWFTLPIVLVLAIGFFVDGAYSLQPYLFHASRSAGAGSLYGMLIEPLIVSLGGSGAGYAGFGLMYVVQAGVALACIFFPRRIQKYVRTPLQLASWSVIAIALFLLCSRFYSPQWILWFLPLLAVCRLRWYETALIIAYDLANYFAFPVVWQLWGNWTTVFTAVSLFLIAVLVVLVMVRAARIRQEADGCVPGVSLRP